MSYTITISGHVDSAKQEAEILSAAADFAEAIGANGSFGFAGNHVPVSAAPAADGVAKARQKVAEYNLTADADDQVGPTAPVVPGASFGSGPVSAEAESGAATASEES